VIPEGGGGRKKIEIYYREKKRCSNPEEKFSAFTWQVKGLGQDRSGGGSSPLNPGEEGGKGWPFSKSHE